MNLNKLDASLMQKAFLAGARELDAKKDWINELNVFPVPDGDTGTNMSMTIMAAAREVAVLEEPTMESLAKAISSGSLRGARGNSGVILSQLFRGFTKEIKTVETVDVAVLARAFARGTETAYKAVIKPKEGTILTVAKGMAEKAGEMAQQTDDIIEFAQSVIKHGDYVLSQTPELLPVLKQAGVVDSGGQGLMQVMKGVLNGLLDKETGLVMPDHSTMTKPARVSAAQIDTADIHFGYCTEFIINVEKYYDETAEAAFKAYLDSLGDSIVVVSDDDVVKVHVHTNDPGLVIQRALSYGSLSQMKIDNMREEHRERVIRNAQRKPYGFVAVSAGAGMSEIFRGIGADYLIEGGQTMNPSTEDMINAIACVNADTVFILPNNKNIILAAEQAKYMVEDKRIIVVPSKTVPQGITTLINFIPDLSPEENLKTMIAEMGQVKTGQVTYAVRNTMIDGMTIHEGDIMGIGDQGILAVGSTVTGTTLEMLQAMIEEQSELITVYYGEDVTAADAQDLLTKAQAVCPGCEIELQKGGQPIYYYLISVE